MFNTGDLGRWNEHGELEHFGRIDDQVKVKVRRRRCASCVIVLIRNAGLPRGTGWRLGGYGGAPRRFQSRVAAYRDRALGLCQPNPRSC